MQVKELKQVAYNRRLDILEMDYVSKAGHIGGSMSNIDILTCLYYQVMNTDLILQKDANRDRFVLSKGHCAESLYSVLADRGFFPKEELKTYAQFNTRLAEHPTRKVPGVEVATGALGHGLPVAVGMALALKTQNSGAHVYTLMGDGEQAEGSVWEATMAGANFKLGNLTAIVDRNHLQISGNTEDVMQLDKLQEKYEAFGWHTVTCNGHSYEEIIAALHTRKENQPVAIIANTIKGCGSKVMENKAGWHHHAPSKEEYEEIRKDLKIRGEV